MQEFEHNNGARPSEDDCVGYIDSVYCGSGVDGTGLRCVVFFSGCNLRCPFCHNPETLYKKGEAVTVSALVRRIVRYKPYFRRGGVTLSGGEPFLQKQFLLKLVDSLHGQNINVCVETNGQIVDAEMIAACDGIICDVKNQETDDLSAYEKFFKECCRQGKSLQITNVLVPGKNDSIERLQSLSRIVLRRDPSLKVKFLPFRKLCEEKYERLKIPFPYACCREAEDKDIEKAVRLWEDFK